MLCQASEATSATFRACLGCLAPYEQLFQAQLLEIEVISVHTLGRLVTRQQFLVYLHSMLEGMHKLQLLHDTCASMYASMYALILTLWWSI